jgi:hypothetical protein
MQTRSLQTAIEPEGQVESRVSEHLCYILLLRMLELTS